MKSEQEIIEEIVNEHLSKWEMTNSINRGKLPRTTTLKYLKLAVEIALQKGKELERDRQLLEGHEACNLAVVDKIEITEKQASKIADLQKENKELKTCRDDYYIKVLQNYQNFKDEIAKLKEERKQLTDELEENLNIIKSDDCIYRDNPRVYRQIKSLEIIIKFLRGEK